MILYFQVPPLKSGREAARFPLPELRSGHYRASCIRRTAGTCTSNNLAEAGATSQATGGLVYSQERGMVFLSQVEPSWRWAAYGLGKRQDWHRNRTPWLGERGQPR